MIKLSLTPHATRTAPLQVGTHSGQFHADEVFATAILLLVHETLAVERTRDSALLDRLAVVLDVGGRYDPSEGRFDHHQNGGARNRENGTPYATAGLVWAHAGSAAVNAGAPGLSRAQVTEAVQRIDQAFFAHVDAIDCGNDVGGPPAFQASRMISGFNPTWDEVDVDPDARFAEAVMFAVAIVRNLIHSTASSLKAQSCVKQAPTLYDGRILLLDKPLPWSGIVGRNMPDVLFVVFPDSGEGKWLLQVVRQGPGSFAARKDLPAHWAGLRDQGFDEASGVPGGVFCHDGRFVCGHSTQEGALELARLALQD